MRVQSINSNNYQNNYQSKNVGFKGKGDAYVVLERAVCCSHDGKLCQSAIKNAAAQFISKTAHLLDKGSRCVPLTDQGNKLHLVLLSPEHAAKFERPEILGKAAIGPDAEQASILAEVMSSPETEKVSMTLSEACHDATLARLVEWQETPKRTSPALVVQA